MKKVYISKHGLLSKKEIPLILFGWGIEYKVETFMNNGEVVKFLATNPPA